MLERASKWMGLLAALLILPMAMRAQAAEPAPSSGYQYFEIGDPAAQRPGRTEAGLMLVGGGDWPHDAFRWFIDKAGHGRIVILRASGTIEAQDEFFKDIGGITAAQTIVFSDRKAASDPRVLEIVRNADGIFLAGGDQSNYVRFWKGTPLNAALDAHVRAGKPIGGTSAGLAILGAYSYGAMDGGSLTTEEALRDPSGSAVTLVKDFLHLPYLQNVITDSHFGARDRLGRLIVFLARLSKEEQRQDLIGLGIDEYTALCIDAHGQGRVFSGNDGKVWRVQGRDHDWRGVWNRDAASEVEVTLIGTAGRLHFRGDASTVDNTALSPTAASEGATTRLVRVGGGELRDDGAGSTSAHAHH